MTTFERYAASALAGLLSAGYSNEVAVKRAIEAAEALQDAMTRRYWPQPIDDGLDV